VEEDDYRVTYELEDHNWWFVGTREICLDLFDRAVGPDGPAGTVLDVGCGTGLLLEHLERRAPAAIGVDYSATALGFCAQRDHPRLVQADGIRLPMPDASVDAVTAIGVIEHLDDDEGAIREWARVLRPGAPIVLLTSSYQWLWSGHDVSNHHRRRYTATSFRRLLEGAGLEVRELTYVNTLLFPGIAAVRLVERALRRGAEPEPRKDTGEVAGPFNRALHGVLTIERHALARRRLPFGVSMVASAVPRR
jgi:SAM-dependent methyltransferase